MIRYPSIPFPMPARLYYGWVIVATSLLINMASTALSPVMFSFFIAPMAADLGYSRGVLSWALTVRLLTSAAASLFIGAYIDRHGSRWLGVVGGLVAGGSLMALSQTNHLWMILLIFAVSGVVGLGGGPGGSLVTTVPTAKWFQRSRGKAMSIVTAGMAGGTVLGIPIAQALIHTLGWRGAWIVFGVFMAVTVPLLSVLFMRRVPEDLGLEIEAAPTTGTAREQRLRGSGVDWTMGQALRTASLWIILAALVISGMGLSGTLIYRVGYWQSMGLSPSIVALGTSLDPFAVIFSVMVFGMLAERISLRVMGLIGCLGLAASMVPMMLPHGGVVSIMSSNLGWGVAAGAYVTINNLVWPNYFGRKHLGSIRGIVFPATVAANALAGPVYGFLLDSVFRAQAVWAITAVLFVVSGALLYLAKPPVFQESERQAAPAELRV